MRRLARIFAVCFAPWFGACTRSDPPSPLPAAPAPAPAATAVVATTASAPTAPEADALPAEAPDGSRVVYPFGRVHSPMGPLVIRSLGAIAARDPSLRKDAFIKVGDSITFSDDSMHCLGRREPELAEHADLGQTLARFRGEASSKTRPFTRQSHAAKIGWSAWQALSGAPPPVQREINQTKARFALVQYGTNDLEIGAIHYFADSLWNIVDYLTARGVIPVLFSIPARRDRADRDVWVSRYNAVVRGIAQSAQVPFVDYHLALSALPGQGLGRDGIHPTTYHGPRGRDACALHAEGLRHGYNLRNLLVLQALDRASRALDGRPVLADGESEPNRVGAGSFAEPLEVLELPFVDVFAHEQADPRRDEYSCAGARVGPGPERVYRLRLERATSLRIEGYDRKGQLDLHLLSNPAPDACLRSAERVISARLPAGTYFLVVDEVSRARADTPPTSLLIVQEQ